MLFAKTDYDEKVYREQLENYLPDRMIDIHCHVWKDSQIHKPAGAVQRSVVWPSLVAKDNPVEDLQETYKIMFPGKTVSALMFANPSQDLPSLKRMNDYVSECSSRTGFPALYFSHPTESAEELETAILKGGFLGVKAYLDLADPTIPTDQIRIFDFFPHAHLKKLDEMGAIAMCHIPRKLRFRDPVNLADIKEIASTYPNLKLIIAHIGRAYIPSDMGNALEYLSDCKNLLFDFCANTCSYAMYETLKSVGDRRMLFGSDLPILRMRMRRIEENGTYINLVPPKIYGDPSQDPHLREVSEKEAERLTYFMYEEILAMKQATEKLGYSKEQVENLFFNNADNLINSVRKNIFK